MTAPRLTDHAATRILERVCHSIVAGAELVRAIVEQGQPVWAENDCTAYTGLGWRVVVSSDGWVRTVMPCDQVRRPSPKKAAKRAKQARRERIRLATMP